MRTITVDLTAPIPPSGPAGSGPGAAHVAAAPGDTIALRLSEISSTAYSWQLVTPLPDGMVALESKFIPDPVPLGPDGQKEIMTGGSGIRVFTYRCDRATAGELSFKLSAPWDQGNPLEGRRVIIVCK